MNISIEVYDNKQPSVYIGDCLVSCKLEMIDLILPKGKRLEIDIPNKVIMSYDFGEGNDEPE